MKTLTKKKQREVIVRSIANAIIAVDALKGSPKSIEGIKMVLDNLKNIILIVKDKTITLEILTILDKANDILNKE